MGKPYLIPKSLQKRNSGRFFVGRASRLPSNNLSPQAGRPRYISEVQKQPAFVKTLQLCVWFVLGLVALIPSSFAQTTPLQISSPADLGSVATGAAVEPIVLQAVGGTQPYTWSLVTGGTAGVLPPGLALAADGRITGTPTTAQMARSFTVRVTDAGNATVQKAFTIAVGTDSPRISTAAMSGARVGEAYSHTFQVLQGKTPYAWSTNSTLPTGLTLNPTTGVISGTPETTTVNSTASFRDYPIALRLTASGNATTTANFTLTVAKPMQWVTPPNLPVQFAGPNCTIGLSVSGGKAPYQFTLASGSTLPPGITLGNATGILSGKPSAVGNYSFTINARDSVGSTISRAFAIQFIPYTLTISGPASASGTQYSSATPLQFSAIGGAEPYRYAATNLPAGLTLNATSGLITGNFNGTAGTTNFTVTVTDNKAMTANATCAYTITAGPVLKWTIDPALPAGKVPDAYSATLPAASGGWAPYTYTVNASTIPVGLTFNATARRLSGTPKTSGNFAVVLTVRDSATPPNVVNATLANSTSPTIPLSIAAYAMTINGTSSLSVNQYAALPATPFTVAGGVAPYTWSTASALPATLKLAATGANGTAATLSGNATAAPGNYTIGVRVTDKLGFSTTSNVTLTISPLQVTWGTQPLLPAGKVASAYTTNLTVSGGRPGYTYVLKNGSVLPAGLALNATTGVISGTPTKESAGVNPSLSGIVTTLAGSGSAAFADGQGTAASFNQHTGVAVDASGNVYSADWSNNRIRKISPSGNVTTLAGSGSAGYVDGQGAAASFYFPNGVAVDLGGNVYVTDSGNNRIRKISPSGHVTTLAGSGNASFADGQGTEASFNAPSGVAVDASGNVYVADRSNHRIRKISSSGNVTTLAGSGSPGFADGQGGAAIFNFPRGVAVDADGNVYVSDRDNQRIRKISLSGNVTTLAGSGTAGFANGQGAMASFNSPREVAVDSSGNVYVAEGNNHRIRKITPSGNVTTLAGSGVSGYSDGQGAAASFASPQGVAVDAIGNAYVADTGNNRIRKITTGLSADKFTITASDSASPVKNTAEREFTLPIASYGMAVGGPVSGSGAQYSSLTPAQFTVSGGVAPHRWSTTGLPATLSINATTGLVSGNLTAAPGNYTANITVTDNRSQTATKNFTVTVSALPISWSTNATLPAGKVADAYSTNLTVSSGRPPYSFALSNSTLPLGLALNAATGLLSGTPTTAGNYTFTINASDSAVPKNTINRTFTLAVAPYGMEFTGPASIIGQQYSTITPAQFTLSGGTAPFTLSATGLPTALTVNATSRAISGTLMSPPGNYTSTITLRDAKSQSVTRNLTVTILPAPPVTWPSDPLPPMRVGIPYSANLTVSGGRSPYTFSANASTLPTGLTLSAAGVLSGTPTRDGNFTFTISAGDSGIPRNTANRTYTVSVEPYGMSISGNAVISGKQFTAITPVQLSVNGGIANFTWSANSTTGLTVNASTGLLSGNLTANPGNYTFAVSVRDGRNQTATRNMTVSILQVDPINWVTNATLTPGKVAENYSANLTVKDGTPPYTFATKNGSVLPGNLTLTTTTGVLRGQPTAAGNFTFTLVARDSGNATAERAFTLAVAPYGMAITNEPPITGQVNQAFSYAFAVANGSPAYTWNATGAPTGLTMNATTGILSGTPTASGNFVTTVRVTDGKAQAVSRNYTISIAATAPLSISTPPNLGTIDISKGYTTTLQAVGGRPPYTWTINGTRPASVNLAANGTLTANSSTALTANFTVRVQDSSTPAANATQVMTLTYRNPAQLTVATSSLPQGRLNAEYSQQLAATGGSSPYQWAITAGTLPTGMVFSPTGWLSGTPTATANTILTFEVTDSAAAKSTRQLQLVIGSAAGNATASGKLFTDVTSVANLPEHYIIAVEDFDNDGREDLLATNAAGSVVLLANAGAFDFRDITANAGLTDAQPALVADFNNDGVSDILSVNLQRSEATLFLNNGQGVFTKQPLTGLLIGDLANYRDISFADVDGDGDLDLLFNINAASGGAVVAVFNQANVSQKSAPLFSGKSYLVKTTWKNAKFSVTDANGDGKPDLVVLQTNGAWPTDTHRSNPASLYLNTGNSTADYSNATGAKTLAGFTIKPNSGITAGNEMSAFTSFDIDNDGDLDLINGSSDWPSVSVPRIYINDGTGTYTQKDSPILHGSYYHHGATIFDADLDGDQDAVWTSLHVFKDVYPRMWENGATYLKATANGTVDPAKAFYDSTTDWGVTAKIAGSGNMGSAGYAADLDGDGDLDFVTNLWSNTTTYKIYRNDSNLRQANWLKVELIGAVSPAQGTGARVEVELKDATAKKPSQLTGASRYEMVSGSFSWSQAKAHAEAKGGHLATITSENEWNQIVGVIGQNAAVYQCYWLGASDADQEGSWRWITGEPWGYQRWMSGEPNNSYGEGRTENYLQANHPGHSPGTWNDVLDNWPMPYLLEYDQPNSSTTTTKLAQYLGYDSGAATLGSLTFGLADKTQAAKVTVFWPSGLKSVLENVDGNRTIQIREADELPLPRPTDEGDVIAWGANPNGETSVPTNLGKAVQIAAGDSSSAALLANGTVSVWGTNWAAQRNVPATLSNVVQIAAGNNHYLALTANGSVVAWGWNTTNQTVVPTTIKRAKFIAAGFNSSYAITGDGRIVAWGANDVGQLNVPAALSGVTTLSAGRGHVLALKKDGTVVAWGRNDLGQATVPAGLTNVIQIAAGDYHSLALKSDGTIVAWGANWISQSTIPAGLGNVVQISAKGDRSLALKADNSVVSWGLNADNIAPPPAPGTILGISAGSKHSLGLVRKIQIALTGDLPVLKENQPLSDLGFTATGGSGNYTWSVVGTKPDWLTLNATTGLLSGTPTTAGNQTVTVRVSSGGRWSDIGLTFEIQKAIPTALWVATTGNNTTGDGSLPKPFATITKAQSVANRGDVIKVLPGNYTESVVIEKSLEISSTAGPAKTTIRSAGLASAVYCKGAGVKGGKLIGLTLTGGGGANNSGNNRYGGGFAINAPTGTTYEVKNCIITDNNNAGITYGGGLHATGGTTLSLTNSLVKNNAAWASGGAALIEGANLIADRCTIVSNTNNAFNRIGGISAAGNCNIQIKNSILWNNSTNQYGSFSSGPGGNATFTFSYSDIQGGTTATVGGNTKTLVVVGPGNINSDPKFAETTNYTLGTGSPCINTGDPNAAKDADSTRADMGWDAAAASAGADSDDDGIPDALEEKDGTNPNDPTSFDSLSRGLVAYYPFNGNANDESGGGINFSGQPSFGSDRFSQMASAANYNTVAPFSSSNITLGANGFSVGMWVRLDRVPSQNGERALIHGSWNHGASDPRTGIFSIAFWDNLRGAISIIDSSNTSREIVTAPKTFPANQWFSLLCTSDGTNLRMFLNGKLIGSMMATLAIKTNSLSLGGDASHYFSSGMLDDIRIYNRALTAAEVSQLYSRESGQPNTVLVQGGTLPAGSALAGQAVSPFHIARFETTWAEWKTVRTWAAANGYDIGSVGQGSADNHPVRNVSWYDAVKWLNAKSQMEGFMPVYSVNGTTYKSGQSIPTLLANANGYRLPVEAEWEWAARGGVSSQGYTYSGSNDVNAVAWTWENSSGAAVGLDTLRGTWPVGQKASNELGIYDMSGNALEWCYDTVNGSIRRFRGGSWINYSYAASVSIQGDGATQEYRGHHYGFRYARNAVGDMVTVPGGTLPQSSGLAGQSVQAFQIGKYEVTWGEWKTVRTWAVANGYTDLVNVGEGSADNHPVRNASWYNAMKWCNAKSQQEGLTPVYEISGGAIYKLGLSIPIVNPAANGYRLPLEKEWEWAARGGIHSKGYTYSGSSDVNAVAWWYENSTGAAVDLYAGRGTWPVGVKMGNELGIFDMSGNMWEWCWDLYEAQSTDRLLRGSGWGNHSPTVTERGRGNPGIPEGSQGAGFRLARNIGPKISISGTMPEPTLNQSYAGYTFTASGATSTPVWSVSSGSLPPGMSFNATTATLSGTPTTIGNSTFTVRIESGGYWDEMEVQLQVVGPGPIMEVRGNAENGGINFGQCGSARWYPPAYGYITISNVGSEKLIVDLTSVGGIYFNPNYVEIEPGEQEEVFVRYDTISYYSLSFVTGPFDFGGSFSLVSNAVNSPVGLTYYGEISAPSVEMTGSLDFGDVEVGESAERDITITNTGNDYLSGALDFSYGAFSGSDPISLAPGESQNVTVTFRPTGSGAYSQIAQFSESFYSNVRSSAYCSGNGVLPSNPDTDNDGDGVSDSREAQDGTNPNDPTSFDPLSRGLVAYYPFNGNANDESGNNNDGIINGATLAEGIDKDASGSFSFNGISDYILIPHSEVQRVLPITISLNFKTNQSEPHVTSFLNKYYNSSFNGYRVGLINGKIEPWYLVNNSQKAISALSGNVNDGNWHQVVVTVDASGIKTFVDSKLVSSGEWQGSPALFTSNNPIYLGFYEPGATHFGTPFFKGAIDEVRIYNRALTAAEVSQLYAKESRQSNMVLVKGGNRPNQLTGSWERIDYATNETSIDGWNNSILITQGADISINYFDNSAVTLSGFDHNIKIDGGIINGNIISSGFRHTLNISGGFISGDIELWAIDNVVNFYGYDLVFSGTAASGKVKGFLSDNSPIDINIVGGHSNTINLISTNQTVSPFQISRFETTWAEWKTVRAWAAANGYDIGSVGQGSADNHPVRNVNWYDSLKWCNAKSQMEGVMPVYSLNGTTYKTGQSFPAENSLANGYRLPTEKEWEWAARGGIYSMGYNYSGGNNIDDVGWYSVNAAGGTNVVGSKNTNEIGLYDLSGNIAEWCFDAPSSLTTERSVRGGSFYYNETYSRIAYRGRINADYRGTDYGFRYARNAIGDMVTVQGGTLPQSSGLAGQSVQAFQIGRTEVTWGEWKTVRTWAVANGYTDLANTGAGSGDEHPVRNISWYDAVKWTNAKSQMEGLEPFYILNGTIYKIGQAAPMASASANGYRLPAEAEWEWAARGGVASHGYSFSGGNNLSDVGWYYVNSSGATVNLSNGRGTWPVGLKKPNELGIFDMSGNVWELCQDVVNNNSRRSRGGGWGDSDANGISVTRQGDDFPYDHKSYLGFRLARNIGPKISISGTMPEATLNQAYAVYTFTASGATTAPVWSVSSGSLPPGMSFNATTATLSGTPTTAGNYTFTIKVTSGGYSDEVEVDFEIAAPQVNYAEMVLVQGGTLPAGSALANQTVSAFHIAKFETTWGEWQEVRNWAVANGYNDLAGVGSGSTGNRTIPDNYPVLGINWHDAIKWCNAKSEKEGLAPFYLLNGAIYRSGQGIPSANYAADGYRLPIEAEWEWAARGGVKSQGYIFSGSNNINLAAWYYENSIGSAFAMIISNGVGRGTWPVGQKLQNELGVNDMSGSVLEWCWDVSGSNRSVRGGSWASTAESCAVAYRFSSDTNTRGIGYGFRYVRNAIGDMVTVQGGALPAGSGLAGQTVSAFQIGRTEVTWDEWQTIRNWAVANGYTDLAGVGNGTASGHPVQNVNWYEVLKWMNAKSQIEGLTPVYSANGSIFKTGEAIPTVNPIANGYRLPLEAEWEWAARGGLFSKGYVYSGSNNIDDVAWYSNNTVGSSKIVGTKAQNELGIFDMSGNLFEWIADAQSLNGSIRARGGGRVLDPIVCSVSDRSAEISSLGLSNEYLGFRLARNIGPKISISSTMPEATLNQAYAGYTFTASATTGAPAWSVSSGTLPPGMSFNATTATLSGTPTAVGNYTFTIKVASGGYSDEVEVDFEIAAPQVNYAEMVTVQGGTLPQSSGLAGQSVQDFQIGKYEVTWGEWKSVRDWAVLNGYPDLINIGAGSGDDHPVRNVSWFDVLKWCNAKSQREGLTPVYLSGDGSIYKVGESVPTWIGASNGYRLLLEKEWEWAARGGISSLGYSYSGSNDANLVAWHAGNSGLGTKPIGLKFPNELGIYDMSGNVFEWCWNEVSGIIGRRNRGGAWTVNSDGCQISIRGYSSPNNRDGYNGFRLGRITSLGSIIEPTKDGWSFSGALTDGREALAYQGSVILYRGTLSVSTNSTLFVGTPEQIEAHIAKLGLEQP
jgi:formylglycine-generating enzyme required for sulfatase activity